MPLVRSGITDHNSNTLLMLTHVHQIKLFSLCLFLAGVSGVFEAIK